MLQVWKIEVLSNCDDNTTAHGWALAHTVEEAKSLSGFENVKVQQMPEHLWIVRERIVWEKRTAA